MARVTLRLPEDLHRRLRATAERTGSSLNQLIVAALGYVPELGSTWVASLCQQQPAAISLIAVPELASALARRAREGALSLKQRDMLFRAFLRDAPIAHGGRAQPGDCPAGRDAAAHGTALGTPADAGRLARRLSSAGIRPRPPAWHRNWELHHG